MLIRGAVYANGGLLGTVRSVDWLVSGILRAGIGDGVVKLFEGN